MEIFSEVHHYLPILITALVVFLAIVYRRKNENPKKKIIPLDQLCDKLSAFNPEPLAPGEDFIEPLIPLVNNTSAEILIPEAFKEYVNLACNDFLNFFKNEGIKSNAAACIRSNGVGSCGPRGFYGSIDVHLDLEARIADFMGLEESVLYSYGVSTMSSAIIAYCKMGDVIFCDEKVMSTTLQGIKGAKCTIVTFKHNNTKDLEQKLLELNEKEQSASKKKRKPRRFLIVEGLYMKTGQICPLPELMVLREKYMMRLFLDETLSFGALGKHGRGVTEYFNVDRTNIDLIVGSLEYGVSSIGGFCVGSSFVVEHQRLSGLGYCFSASLSPFLSSIALQAINIFEESPEIFEKLNYVAEFMHKELLKVSTIQVKSDAISPRKVIQINERNSQEVAENCKKQGLIILTEDDNHISFNIKISMDEEFLKRISRIIEWSVMTN